MGVIGLRPLSTFVGVLSRQGQNSPQESPPGEESEDAPLLLVRPALTAKLKMKVLAPSFAT